MKEELKPCPFCGGTDLEKMMYLDLVGWMYWIECKSCDHVRAVSLADIDDAIRKWNTRPAEDKLKQVNECIKRECDVLRVREKNIMCGYQKSINRATVFEYFLHSISKADYGKNLNSLSKTKLIEYLRFIQRNAIEILRGQE